MLLDNGCFEGAYYLSGYVVECALKACIARQTQAEEFPDLIRARQVHTHDLLQLMRNAGLETALNERLDSDPDFRKYWRIAREWTEASRYTAIGNAGKARKLFEAVSHEKGVFAWLQLFW